MSRAQFGALALGLCCCTPSAFAGAFIFSENTGLPVDVILHPTGYTGTGGTLTNTVCLNTSILPSGVSADTVEATLLKALRTMNRQRAVTRNLAPFGSNNDVANSAQLDYESTLVHELGHCVGLAHPNLATESGLSDPDRNSTQARSGTNASFDIDDGADNLMGSRDDLRGDDVNRYWFRIGSNDPMAFPSIIDPNTFTLNLGSLPGGHSFAANGDRSVLAALGYANTESAMQQGQTNDEVQRRLTFEDLATLRIGMAGLDRTQGTADDYTLELQYVGRTTSRSCDITVEFNSDGSFAFCSLSAFFVGSSSHLRATNAYVSMSDSTNWYFSQSENTQISGGTSPASPAQGVSTTVNVAVDRLSSAMTGTPSGSFEATLAGGSCSGTLSASDADTSAGSCALTPTQIGSQTLNLLYLGDLGFDASESSVAVTVTSAAPTVSFGSVSPSPSTVGQSYTVPITVSGSSGTPTGTVSVSDGSVGCSITLSGGSGSCSLASTTAGSKTLTATYSGDGTYSSAANTRAHTVNQATPTVSITADTPDPSVVGQSYSIAVTVSGAGVTPTGTVSISDGGSPCVATLSGGSGSCNLTSSTSGVKTLTATYQGDANYTTASDTEAHTVNGATPTVAITSDTPDPSAVGQSYTVSFTVSGSVGTPTGEVTVSDGASSCNGSLSAGSGSCALASTTTGSKTLTASYAGDAAYTSGSDTEAHTVSKATPSVSITSDTPDPSALGAAYTVAVSVSGAGATPGGTVSISDGTDSCDATLSAGSGSCALSSTTAGSKTLTASYAGDDNYLSANGTATHTVNKGSPTVAITGDTPDPSAVTAAYTVTVAVSGSGVVPSGTVSISDGTGSCNATLSGGSGSCALSSESVGSLTLTASYPGDANYNAGSDTEPHTVQKAPAVVSITSDAPDPSAVGQPYTIAVSVSGSAGAASGSVAISDGNVGCNAVLSGGSGSCQISSTSLGLKTLSASYSGDDRYLSGIDTESHTVVLASPIVTITDDAPDPSEVGAPFTVSVSVNGSAGAGTGSVQISDGEVSCNAVLAAGSGSCALTPTSLGLRTITASYSGSAIYAAGSDTESHIVNAATSTTRIESVDPSAPELGDEIEVTVEVSGTAGTPGGSVAISLDGDNCTATLSSGSGSCRLSAQQVGSRTLQASYAASDVYASSSDSVALPVSQATSALSILSVQPDPALLGLPYSIDVEVARAGIAASGSVSLSDGEDSCIATLVSGTGSCSLTPSAPGPRTVQASYAGDARFAAASASRAIQVISAASFIFADGFEAEP